MRATEFRRPVVASLAVMACLFGFVAPQALGVGGVVLNGTTGRPQAGVMLTLSSFRGGMTPVEETQSEADGRFEFTKELPAVASGQPFLGAIRAEHEGVGYTEILRGDTTHDDLRVTVYSAADSDLPAPWNRVVIVEPGTQEMVVRESFQFVNDATPPVTFSSADGTLQFYLPGEAGGNVEVSGTGPAGMPLRSTALPTGIPDLHRVDFPLKPGESRIDLQYSMPYEDGVDLVVRTAYQGLESRVAAPLGVTVEGVGIRDLGQEPTTQASIWAIPPDPSVTLSITGVGQLSPSAGGAENSGSSGDFRIAPAPIAEELVWIVGLAIGIFAVGFLHLWSAKPPGTPDKPNYGHS